MRFYFRRKSGYMSPYTLRQALFILRTYPGRGLSTDPLYVQIGTLRPVRMTRGTR